MLKTALAKENSKYVLFLIVIYMFLKSKTAYYISILST